MSGLRVTVAVPVAVTVLASPSTPAPWASAGMANTTSIRARVRASIFFNIEGFLLSVVGWFGEYASAGAVGASLREGETHSTGEPAGGVACAWFAESHAQGCETRLGYFVPSAWYRRLRRACRRRLQRLFRHRRRVPPACGQACACGGLRTIHCTSITSRAMGTSAGNSITRNTSQILPEHAKPGNGGFKAARQPLPQRELHGLGGIARALLLQGHG